MRTPVAILLTAVFAALLAAPADAATSTERALDRALRRLVDLREGPPGAIALVQRGDGAPEVRRAGVARVGSSRPPQPDDRVRLASVAKAFSGAAALELVDRGVLSLDDTVAQRVTGMPPTWGAVTLRELLSHTGGIPNFTDSPAVQRALRSRPQSAPAPRRLIAFVADEPLAFTPGRKYAYSNTDNIIVGLMVEAAAGVPYERFLAANVYAPLGLRATALTRSTRLPRPFLHGYDVPPRGAPEDISEAVNPAWTWASGGLVSTPRELNAFIRAYVGGRLFGPAVQDRQRQAFPGGTSEPPGPGPASSGLGVFRYDTRCGTVWGHTGNFPGYTEMAIASPDGSRSATVTASTQLEASIKPRVFRRLRRVFTLAACAALQP